MSSTGHALDPVRVEVAFQEIARSQTFAKNDRLLEFLHFVIRHTLDGELDRLKESVIGVEVYRREPSYSPKSDPIVRTEARRLRKKLADYYEQEGSRASIVIVLPVGGYVARFEVRGGGVSQSADENGAIVSEIPAFPADLSNVEPVGGVARPRRRLWFAALGSVSAVLGLTVFWIWTHESRAGESFVSSQLTSNDGSNPIAASAISPDGRFLVYADATGLFERSLTSGMVRPLALPADLSVQHLAWNADSSAVVVSAKHEPGNDYQLLTLNSAGRVQRLLSGGTSASFSPDGHHLIFLNEDGSKIEIASADGSSRRTFVGAPKDWRFTSAVWSTDGRRILCIEQRSGPESLSASTRSIETRSKRRYLAFNFADERLVASEYPFPFDSLCPLRNNQMLMVRPYMPTQPFGVWTARTDAGTGAILGQPELTISTSNFYITSLSTTANKDAVSGLLDRGEADVYVGAANSDPLASAKRLTFDLRNDFPDAWTPDGRAVIFESDRSGQYHLYRQNLDSKVAQVLTDQPGEQIRAAVSPDGKWLLFAQVDATSRADRDRLFRVAVAGGGRALEVPLHHFLDEYRCPLKGNTCVIRETIGQKRYRFYALDPIAGQGAVLADIPWIPSVFGDWTVAADGSAVALPVHGSQSPEILVVPLGSSTPTWRIKLRSQGELWGIQAAAKGQNWYGEIRADGKHQLSLIKSDGTVNVLHESDYNIWGSPSPDGLKLAFVDYGLDRNVWIWRRKRS
jgi:Tol biopolymer transport system component